MSIFAKLAGQRGIPVFEIVLVRSAIVVAFAAAKLAYEDVPGEPLLGHRRWLLLLRGMCGFGAGRWACFELRAAFIQLRSAVPGAHTACPCMGGQCPSVWVVRLGALYAADPGGRLAPRHKI